MEEGWTETTALVHFVTFTHRIARVSFISWEIKEKNRKAKGKNWWRGAGEGKERLAHADEHGDTEKKKLS